MLEAIADYDDELLMKYVDGIEISPEEVKTGIRNAVIAGKAVPVLCGTALKNKGVQPLLDAIVSYLPAPTDVPPVAGFNPVTEDDEARSPNDNEPFCALAFKIMTDPPRWQTDLPTCVLWCPQERGYSL